MFFSPTDPPTKHYFWHCSVNLILNIHLKLWKAWFIFLAVLWKVKYSERRVSAAASDENEDFKYEQTQPWDLVDPEIK